MLLKMFYDLLILSWLTVASESVLTNNVTYCSPLGPCPASRCCQPIYRGLCKAVSNYGTCEELPFDGDPCDINCPCSPGYKCQLNPLCPKCSAVCMKNSVVQMLNEVLNQGCFGKCNEFDHLFRPKPRVRLQNELCNVENKCSEGLFCAPNILCKHCDYVCMHEDLVKLLMLYYEKGCENNCVGQARGTPDILVSKYDPNKVPLDKNGLVEFPEYN